ncbi:hypothetical protein [Embleya sp. MST-111070]|uniref:hypothetical protein n=1 Tax=Embleya sp. MST-111070 TaxID=3398231 RepID=UPI003F73DBA4
MSIRLCAWTGRFVVRRVELACLRARVPICGGWDDVEGRGRTVGDLHCAGRDRMRVA